MDEDEDEDEDEYSAGCKTTVSNHNNNNNSGGGGGGGWFSSSVSSSARSYVSSSATASDRHRDRRTGVGGVGGRGSRTEAPFWAFGGRRGTTDSSGGNNRGAARVVGPRLGATGIGVGMGHKRSYSGGSARVSTVTNSSNSSRSNRSSSSSVDNNINIGNSNWGRVRNSRRIKSYGNGPISMHGIASAARALNDRCERENGDHGNDDDGDGGDDDDDRRREGIGASLWKWWQRASGGSGSGSCDAAHETSTLLLGQDPDGEYRNTRVVWVLC